MLICVKIFIFEFSFFNFQFWNSKNYEKISVANMNSEKLKNIWLTIKYLNINSKIYVLGSLIVNGNINLNSSWPISNRGTITLDSTNKTITIITPEFSNQKNIYFGGSQTSNIVIKSTLLNYNLIGIQNLATVNVDNFTQVN